MYLAHKRVPASLKSYSEDLKQADFIWDTEKAYAIYTQPTDDFARQLHAAAKYQ